MYPGFKIPVSFFKQQAGNTEKTIRRPQGRLHAFRLYANQHRLLFFLFFFFNFLKRAIAPLAFYRQLRRCSCAVQYITAAALVTNIVRAP